MKQSKYLEGMAAPVDPKTFLFMTNVYMAAAGMTMPVENPASKAKFTGPDGTVFALSDIPINRGMLAVVAELRKIGVEVTSGYCARVMFLDEVFQEKERFAEFIKSSHEEGCVMVSEALLMAAAVAKFDVMPPDRLGFDLDDLLAHARRIEAEEGERQ